MKAIGFMLLGGLVVYALETTAVIYLYERNSRRWHSYDHHDRIKYRGSYVDYRRNERDYL